MAQIKRIKRESPISSFQQGAPTGGGAFRLLADGLNELYDRVAPVAEQKMKDAGMRTGREAARADFGGPRSGRTGKGAGYRDAIASIESAGSGDYRAVGPRHAKLGRALGRYQIMEANIGPWSKEVLGREVTAEEFLADDGIQDAIFDHKFGSYVAKFGEDGAAQAWFAGPGGVGKTDRKDSLGTSVGDYTKRFRDAIGAGGSTSEPATMVRTSTGALESRLYSPYSGPILQAHNAAARVAYQAEVLNKSAVDLMDMSQQFPLDPDGFMTAAEKYIDTMADAAPTDYQEELRATLNKEVQRRAFGMMEERQRDIRARANNSSAALVERWSANLTDAILTGDPDQISEAQSQLDGLLQAREALPGVAWTTEQSANVILDARKRAANQAEKRRKEAAKETKSTLELIIEGASNGRHVQGEEILSDPTAIADHPELAREAAAYIALRDNLPDYLEMPPDELLTAAAELAAQEVTEEWQIDISSAAQKVAVANKKAWTDDPVKRASEVMRVDPPPPLPELTLDDPNKIVAGLAERREYMNNLRADGYTTTKSYLSNTEAEALQVAMGTDTPPELRAALSTAIVAGFGPDAVTVFDEIDGDRLTMYAGKMGALGADPALATTILTGQQMLDEGLVRVPPNADRIDAFSTTTASAFANVPGAIDAQSDVMAAAQAIYAANPRSRGLEPTSEAAAELLRGSIQTALGQSKNKRGEVTGGVQDVLGNSTLLPPGVSGEKADEVLRRAMGGDVEPRSNDPVSLAVRWMDRGGRALLGADDADPNAGVWGEGGPPMHNGKPIPPAYVNRGNVRMVPAGGNTYWLEITSGNSNFPAQDADGNVFSFDLQELMDASE